MTVTGKRTVGAVLDTLTKRYRVKVQAVDKFGRTSPLLRKLTSTVGGKKEAFWEVMRKVLVETKLNLQSIDKGRLTISEKCFGDDHCVLGGDAVSAGVFLAVPIHDGFFKRSEIHLWPEPGFSNFSIADIHAIVTLPGGKVLDHKPGGVHTTSPNGAVKIALPTEFDKGVRKATRVELSAVVLVPTKGRKAREGLAKLIPETVAVGDASIRVNEFREVEAKDGKGTRLRLRFELQGTLVGRNDVSIVRGKQEPLQPTLFETADQKLRQHVCVEFAANGKSGLDGYTLNLSTPRPGIFKLGVLGDIQDKAIPAGLAKVTLFRLTQGDFYVIVLKSDGAVIPSGEVFLTSPKGKNVKPNSHRGYTVGKRQNVDLEFEKLQIKGDIRKYTLHVMAPGAKTPVAVKKLAKLVPKTFRAGPCSVVVLGFDEEPDDFGGTLNALRLSIEGTRLTPEMINLLDSRKRPLTATGSSDSTSSPQLLSLNYSSSAVKNKSRSGRLKPLDFKRFTLEIDAPGGVIEHTIRMMLSDVSLVDPRR